MFKKVDPEDFTKPKRAISCLLKNTTSNAAIAAKAGASIAHTDMTKEHTELKEPKMTTFQQEIVAGIPAELPPRRIVGTEVNRAPKRKDIRAGEKRLALENALRYFPKEWHAELASEFLRSSRNLDDYMYRFKPSYDMHARGIEEYPCKTPQAAAIMLMIQNNLDPAVAQHPEELITYGGNGAVFQNWAQYLLTMKYLSEMTEEQTLHMYSGHPMGLFPSSKEAPRVVVTNGMMIRITASRTIGKNSMPWALPNTVK